MRATEFNMSPSACWPEFDRTTESFPRSSGHRLLRFLDDVHYFLWGTDQWRVINGERASRSAHAFRHEVLGLRVDHAIFFCNQEPRRLRSPSWLQSWLLKALYRNWPLHSCRQCNLF